MVLSSRLASSSWISQSDRSHAIPGKEIYERPLGLLELGFYWDGVFERTADTLQHAEIAVDSTRLDPKHACSYASISRTWMRLKQQFPLLGARIEERDENAVFFVVAVESLHQCRPEEITFRNVSSADEALDIMKSLAVNERLLSNDFLARLLVVRRTDVEHVFHIIINVSHAITDGMANITILKTFVDEVARDDASFKHWDLSQQLALSDSTDRLYPLAKFSIAKQRWRLAVAKIITARYARPSTGGHSLPRIFSQNTPYTPAHSKSLSFSFSPEQSQIVIANCRKQKLTFGNAYPIIGQIAVTRLLLRRYLRGEISEEEWEFRKREPMSSAGPMNLRSFQDKAWHDAGGAKHVCVSIGFFYFALPIMPLGAASSFRPGAELPAFETLLSRKRFWLRSRSVRSQADRFIRNPLLLELGSIALPARVERARSVGLQWRKEKGSLTGVTNTILSPMEQASTSFIFCNGGSSMGNVRSYSTLFSLLSLNSRNRRLIFSFHVSIP
ncbi:hypothetical protein HYPSUDRAFT_35660 [Hypholoma sublateritium FD-334 SS-4]|uniref:Condensation domain-containing protein n=1 Tax=Hypholoma sublateritium (strain FD-334 SS-4) TaxID=945553 RepID=A0A0D2LHJ9_HYPSF|nr:hypothetical protein HYPSUDRAFT_35660 [Hypholoma sublateritium FD-334 SS-4]